MKREDQQENNITVTDSGYLLCHECHLINKPPMTFNNDEYECICTRCGSHLGKRIHNSIIRTWSLLLTAVLFYIPANIYPMMIVDSIAGKVESTIMEGVVLFVASGEYFVAIAIFIASIIVPTIKIVGLSVILYGIHRKSTYFYQHKSLMFRFIIFIGRWSMLDVFVVSIMVAIVNFGSLSQIHAGVGSTSFAIVVILTMYAAISFDPRIIWDNTKYDTKKIIKG